MTAFKDSIATGGNHLSKGFQMDGNNSAPPRWRTGEQLVPITLGEAMGMKITENN